MVRAENIHSRLQALRRNVAMVRTFRRHTIEAIRADPYLAGALERYLFLSVQCAIDVAEMFCALRGLERAESMSRGFAILGDAGLLPRELPERLQRMVGFRNALVHGYENLNYTIVEEVLRANIEDLDDFGARIGAALPGA